MSVSVPRPSRSIALVITLATALGGCSAAGPSVVSQPLGASGAPGSSPNPTTAGRPADTSSDAWLVVGERGQPGLRVILASTREQLYELPLGVPGEQWGQIVATGTAGNATVVNEITVQPDLPAWRSRSVEGDWELPTIGYDPLPVGVSADGSVVVLVEAAAPAARTASRFAILAKGEAARVIELPGSLEFDALSPDGSILYVVEHLPAPPDARYQVRAVDVATGLMRDEVITDKRNLDEAMGGWPITQAAHASGVTFTLYRGSIHPFIHALNTPEAWAVCIDLPEIGFHDLDATLDWGIAQSADGRGVWAVNATAGVAVAIDPGELNVRQATTFEASRAAPSIELAKFGHRDEGPVGRRVIATPDGATVFAAGADGIVGLETDRLTVSRRMLEGVTVDALAMSPEASTLYALTRDGVIVRLDIPSGAVLGQVPGDGYDRLVGIVPW